MLNLLDVEGCLIYELLDTHVEIVDDIVLNLTTLYCVIPETGNFA